MHFTWLIDSYHPSRLLSQALKTQLIQQRGLISFFFSFLFFFVAFFHLYILSFNFHFYFQFLTILTLFFTQALGWEKEVIISILCIFAASFEWYFFKHIHNNLLRRLAVLQSAIIMMIILLLASISHQRHLVASHWGLSDSKSTQV